MAHDVATHADPPFPAAPARSNGTYRQEGPPGLIRTWRAVSNR
jgi:hypothetical protein